MKKPNSTHPIRSSLSRLALALGVGLTVVAASTHAAPVATATTETVNGSPYHAGPLIQATVGDLLETSRSSITEGGNGSGTRHLTSSVYDGLVSSGVGNDVVPASRAGYWGSSTAGAHFIEFNLNTTSATQGYNISSIKVIQRGDSYSPQQAWKVAFKPVGSTTFTATTPFRRPVPETG